VVQLLAALTVGGGRCRVSRLYRLNERWSLSKYHGRTVTSNWRRKPLAISRKKDYFCNVVSEDVKIALKNKASFSRKYKKELFVECDQPDCQYVDLNQPPCPLHLDFFAKEIERREEKRRARMMEF